MLLILLLLVMLMLMLKFMKLRMLLLMLLMLMMLMMLLMKLVTRTTTRIAPAPADFVSRVILSPIIVPYTYLTIIFDKIQLYWQTFLGSSLQCTNSPGRLSKARPIGEINPRHLIIYLDL